MEKLSLYSILDISSVILAFIGFYVVAKVWIKWKNTDIEIIKARIFLDKKKFLEKNWKYLFLAGAVLTVHQILSLLFFPHSQIAVKDLAFFMVSETLELMIFALLIASAYEWFRVLLK